MYVPDFLNKFALSKLFTFRVLAAEAQRVDQRQLNAKLALKSQTNTQGEVIWLLKGFIPFFSLIH